VLRRENVSACALEVDDDNKPAIALYEKAGFKKVRILPHYYGQSRHGWKMKMNLAAVAATAVCVTADAPAETPAETAGRMDMVEAARHA